MNLRSRKGRATLADRYPTYVRISQKSPENNDASQEPPELEEAVGEDEVGLGEDFVFAGAQPGHADLAALQWPEDGVKAPGVRRVLLGIVPTSLG